MDAGARGPAEPEKADGDAEGADERGRETFLGLEFAVFVELGFDYPVEVIKEWWDDEDGAEEDAYECQTFFGQVEFINAFEDDGE